MPSHTSSSSSSEWMVGWWIMLELLWNRSNSRSGIISGSGGCCDGGVSSSVVLVNCLLSVYILFATSEKRTETDSITRVFTTLGVSNVMYGFQNRRVAGEEVPSKNRQWFLRYYSRYVQLRRRRRRCLQLEPIDKCSFRRHSFHFIWNGIWDVFSILNGIL